MSRNICNLAKTRVDEQMINTHTNSLTVELQGDTPAQSPATGVEAGDEVVDGGETVDETGGGGDSEVVDTTEEDEGGGAGDGLVIVPIQLAMLVHLLSG